jgi:hypothetical protein
LAQSPKNCGGALWTGLLSNGLVSIHYKLTLDSCTKALVFIRVPAMSHCVPQVGGSGAGPPIGIRHDPWPAAAAQHCPCTRSSARTTVS